MLACVELKLDAEIDYRKTSVMQGVLYEILDPQYVAVLHQNTNHPYSQCVIREGSQCIWQIKTFSEEAYHQIIEKVMDVAFNEIQLKKPDLTIHITGKQLYTKPKKALIDEFNSTPGERYINIRVLTPMAFKQRGKYVILPDCRLMYQSLMNKYSYESKTLELFDEETLEQLVENSEIVRYRTHSQQFPLEGISIPGFAGDFTIRFYGSELIARYIRLLFSFGEYSGVGIKTGMGMGAIKIEEWRRRNERNGKEGNHRQLTS